MTENDAYFAKLTPRQQLNDLIHKYAQAHGGKYGEAWKEFARKWQFRFGKNIRSEIAKKQTIPDYVEKTDQLPAALEIGHEMTEYKHKGMSQ